MLRLTSTIDNQPLTNSWTTFANYRSRSTCSPPVVQGPNHNEENIGEQHGVWKITEKVSFNIASEAKRATFTLLVDKSSLKCPKQQLAVKQCYRTDHVYKDKNLRKMPISKGDNFGDF